MPDRREMSESKVEPLKSLAGWWKPVAAVLGAVILIAAGVNAWGELRPYVTIEEGVAFVLEARELHEAQEVQLEILVGISCETQIGIVQNERRQIERDKIEAENANNAAAVRSLNQQLEDVEDKLIKIKRRCGLG